MDPRIVSRQRAPMAALDPELEEFVRRMQPEGPDQRQQAYNALVGDPASDGELYNAAALARRLGVLTPWHREVSGRGPDEFGAIGAGSDPNSPPWRPIRRQPDFADFQDGPHDPWREDRGIRNHLLGNR
jgi:hypothetical protein